MTAAAAAAAGGIDDDTTMFFPGPNGTRGAPKPSNDRVPAESRDIDVIDDPAGTSTRFDAPSPFQPIDGIGSETTPALLAARAEPLDTKAATKAGRARNIRTPGSAAPLKGSDAAGPAKTRQASRRKPKEPSTILLGLGLGVVVLAGVAAAYLLTRGGGDGTDAGASDSVTAAPLTTTDSTQAAEATTDEVVAGPEVELPPVVAFDQAAVGPISATTEYTINVDGGPPEAAYQLLVDGVPAAEPAAQLPPVSFAPGRHLLEVMITSAAGDTSTAPVVVYAVGEVPTGVSFRANLASVNIDSNIEGWAEAVRRFDDFVAGGHDQLQLMPSDWFPSLSPGYWNLFVGGFGTRAEAEAYCESFGLAVPADCFAVRFDPAAPAGG